MNTDIFLDSGKPKKRLGALVAVLVVAALAIGGAWFLANQLQAAKAAKARRAVAAPVEPAPPAVLPPEPAPTPPPVAAPGGEPTPPAPEPTPAPVANIAQRLAEARELFQNDRCLQARDLCVQILEKKPEAASRAEAEHLLGAIHTTLAFSKRPMPEKTDYTVQAGDTLGGVAKKFNTTQELIRRSNNFTGDVIRLGERLRVLGAQWTAAVNKERNELVVAMNGQFFKRYHVGTGQYSMTPTGTFHVVSRIEHPTWYRAGGAPLPFGDTNNVLGTHWISLDLPHYGIHGTWETNTIGRQSSQGCIRLLNSEVEELYLLLPEGTPVSIAE